MKVGFVIPWYSANVAGGAEFECRVTAEQFLANGIDVEVLTTCVKEFRSDWNVNHFKPGVEIINGVPVRRFPVRKKDVRAFHRVNRKLMNGEDISLKDENVFLSEMIQSEDMVEFMKKHEKDYVFVLIPYMFGTTYFGTLACPERSVLLPCLHDESYAYMMAYGEMFKKAKGIVYNAKSEKELAEKIYDIDPAKGILIGMGMNEATPADPERFKSKYGIKNYLLYAGRKDEGKNVRLLIDYFSHYKECFGGDLNLVLIGSGTVSISEQHKNKDIFDLGFVPIQDKFDAYAGSVALVNPSVNESFSIVMMESWLSGAPVMVNEDCDVMKDHCLSSQGGLFFKSFDDFVGCIEFFSSNPDVGRKMASNGASYVKQNYSWPKVISKYKQAFKQWGFEI